MRGKVMRGGNVGRGFTPTRPPVGCVISRTPGNVPSEIAENVKQDDHEQRNTHEPGNQSLHANLLWLSEGDGADHRRIKQAGGMLPMARSVGCVISRTLRMQALPLFARNQGANAPPGRARLPSRWGAITR